MKILNNLLKSIQKREIDQELIYDLLTFFNKSPKIESLNYSHLSVELKDPLVLFQLIGVAIQKESENRLMFNTNKRKHFGVYYTDYKIAKKIASESIKDFTEESIQKVKFYEPCVGGGIFVIAYLDSIIEKFGLKSINLQRIVDNIYYSDIDELPIKILDKMLPLYISNVYGINIKVKKENYFIGDVLFSAKETVTKNNPLVIFNNPSGFDVVLTNPPYRLLKANTNKYSENGVNGFSEESKKIIKFIKDNNIYKFNTGTLNLYKLFVEEILENYTHSKSKIGLLIPNTILNDKQSEDLRKRILENYSIKKIYVIKEKNDFFPDISQSLIFFNIDKTGKTSDIEIINNITSYSDLDLKGFKISVNTIKSISDSSPIIIETEIGFNILNKISRHKKIKNYVSILNLRGELDLTFHKSYITSSPTKYYLVKGANIEEFSLKGESEFVKEDFLDAITSKSLHSKSERICCQQISNLNSKKRVKFCHIKSNNILGNSCNYISLSSNLFTDGKLSLYYILGILNSNLIDWRFRITSSNNHVSNYEISELPLPEVTDETKKKIESLTKSLMRNNKDVIIKNSLNDLVYSVFNLNDKERQYILEKYL